MGVPLCSLFLFFSPQHKGFCKASLYHSPTNDEIIDVECEIYEPEVSLIRIRSLFFFLTSFNSTENIQD